MAATKRFGLILLAGTTACTTVIGSVQETSDELFRDAASLAVMITTEFSDGGVEKGAGFILSREKDQILVATAAHLVARPTRGTASVINTRFFSSRETVHRASVACTQPNGYDVAVLSVHAPELTAINMAMLGTTASLRRGSAVTAIGNGQRVWDSPSTPDRVWATKDVYIDYRSSTVIAGFSGAPVFDETWSLVGMHLEGDGEARRALAIDALQRAVGRCAGFHSAIWLTASLRTGPICVNDDSPCAVLRDWKAAIESRAIDKVRAVWPSAPRNFLQTNFDDSVGLTLRWSCGVLEVKGDSATVVCPRIQYDYTWRNPSRAKNPVLSERFHLRRQRDEKWVISSVVPSSRPLN